MIAKSDVVILVISASALATGIYRWQSNLAQHTPEATLAQSRQAQPVSAATPTVAQNTTQNPQLISATTQPATVNTSTVNAGSATTVSNAASTQAATQTATLNPAGNTTIASTAPATTLANQPLYGIYVVQSGDFLGKIAEDFNTTVETLRNINDIEGTLINVGQQISYPLPAN